jgi:crotonobetainyl-CoA:carnitine CoA-transferase CaiB-like acyl-CoA transferase
LNTDEKWQKFCEITGYPEWIKDNRFADADSREKNRMELDGLIEEWTSVRTVEEIMSLMRPAEIEVKRPLVGESASDTGSRKYYKCLSDDRWCAVSVSTDEEWRSFCGVLGNPDWTKDPKFGTFSSRKENEEELDGLINAWTAGKTAEEVMHLMQAAGVAAGVLNTGEDQLEYDPQLKHRRFFREVDHPRMGVHHPTATPFKLSKFDCEIRRAPLLGEHNEYILKEILGYSDEEIARLVIEGAVE